VSEFGATKGGKITRFTPAYCAPEVALKKVITDCAPLNLLVVDSEAEGGVEQRGARIAGPCVCAAHPFALQSPR
jgi:hypothetical protein